MVYGIIALLAFLLVVAGCVATKKASTSNSISPLLELSLGLSDQNSNVMEEVRLYIDNAEGYFKRFEDELYQRGIEESSEVTPPIVLVDALNRAEGLLYQDGSSEPSWTLKKLDDLSGGKLKSGTCYQELEKYYETTKYGIGTFLAQDGEWPSIFECVKSTGLSLMAINEDSDSYALILVESSSKEEISTLAKSANIKLYFESK